MAEIKNVHVGHRSRLKQRALQEGIEAFSPHQIMELLLFFAIPRRDVSELAHTLIHRFGSVEAVLAARKEELISVCGIGEKAALTLKDIDALTNAYAAMDAMDRNTITNTAEAMERALSLARKQPANTAWQICLSATGAVLSCVPIADSMAWGEAMTLREAVRDMVGVCAKNAVVVVLTEYVDGKGEEYDVRTAEQYGYTLSVMECELLDVVITDGLSAYSLSANGDYARKKFGAAKSVLSENY